MKKFRLPLLAWILIAIALGILCGLFVPAFIVRAMNTFDAIFGMSTTMGEKGKPTEIDFDKSFVIAVEEGQLNKLTELEPGLLLHDDDGIKSSTPAGHLTFKYYINEGDEISYTIRPVLIIIVDKAYQNLNVETIGEVARQW